LAETEKKSPLASFFAELRRRRVIRVIVFYAIAAWVMIEVAATVMPAVNLPEWTVTLVIMLLALGFPIAIVVAWAFDIGPGGIHRTEPLAEPGTDRGLPAEPGKASDVNEVTPVTEAPAASKPTQDEADETRSIAVLPFVNMSGDAENEYFSDGISEELLNLLAKLPQLKVSSRTSSFAFKGQNVDIPTVAEKLGVSILLEGSVRRAGDSVRITAQLIDTESDTHLWSETYDREFKDVFAIQDDIAHSIVDALQMTLTPKERRSLQAVATADAQAYDYYLRGRKFFYMVTKRNIQHALQMYSKAIALDPKYALAYAGIADSHSFLFMYGDATQENLDKADEASRKAIELDPDSAEARASRGIALSVKEHYDEAEREFETAILLNPALFEAYYFYARDCVARGKIAKAARLFTQACEVNPSDYQSPSLLMRMYMELDRPKDAEAAGRRCVEIVEKHLERHPDDARALYLGAGSLASLGETGRAKDWASRALDTEREEPAVLYNVACVFAQLGEPEQALEALEKSIGMGFGYRAWIENDTDLVSLRDEPRFAKLLDSLK
jgi:adenylate cyclase